MLFNTDAPIIAGIVLAVPAYYLLRWVLQKTLSHKKELIIRKHRMLRQQSLQLMQSVSQHMLAKNAETEAIAEQVTYGDFYRQLKVNHVSNLSDKFLIKIKHSNNPMMLEKAGQKLERQERRLKEAETLLAYARH